MEFNIDIPLNQCIEMIARPFQLQKKIVCYIISLRPDSRPKIEICNCKGSTLLIGNTLALFNKRPQFKSWWGRRIFLFYSWIAISYTEWPITFYCCSKSWQFSQIWLPSCTSCTTYPYCSCLKLGLASGGGRAGQELVSCRSARRDLQNWFYKISSNFVDFCNFRFFNCSNHRLDHD